MRTKLLILSAAALMIAGCNASANNQQKQSDNDQQAQTAQDDKKETKKMKVQELNVADFKQKVMDYDKHPNEWVFAGDKPAVIDFYATWCGPCKATAPNIEKLAETYAGKLDVYKVDVDKEPELAGLFGIRSIPTILFIPMNGDPSIQVGAMSYAQLNDVVSKMIK
ncbi:MAG: thioredoxin [Bacteroidales bacterium]|nr:thioredoxin [Bacteroidales bacterium]MDY6000831.1 thioredoxin [Candidatus Cryptobacteroides sp.]